MVSVVLATVALATLTLWTVGAWQAVATILILWLVFLAGWYTRGLRDVR